MVAENGTKPSDYGAEGLRADARRNRQQILAAARDLFVDKGAEVPFDEIARRAGVGIATLYRRFPDRPALVRAVALDVLNRAAIEVRAAAAEEPDAFAALARYMHGALDLRISAVMPVLVQKLPADDEELARVRREAVEPVVRLIETAQAMGSLRPDVAFGDIGPMLVRLSRPLPGPVPRALDRQLAHRALAIFLDGLRPACVARPSDGLPGPTVRLADLQALASDDA